MHVRVRRNARQRKTHQGSVFHDKHAFIIPAPLPISTSYLPNVGKNTRTLSAFAETTWFQLSTGLTFLKIPELPQKPNQRGVSNVLP